MIPQPHAVLGSPAVISTSSRPAGPLHAIYIHWLWEMMLISHVTHMTHNLLILFLCNKSSFSWLSRLQPSIRTGDSSPRPLVWWKKSRAKTLACTQGKHLSAHSAYATEVTVSPHYIRNEGILWTQFTSLPCLPSFGQGQAVQLATLLFAVRFTPLYRGWH